ncbi:secreted RxLR effector protein 161-like [Rhagoletis pomonella]|uniref:secreted RxLR effector protein 161-like n=1 Tax=Rhagoletis pomonella TaxID=28610 RepID=UPI00177F14B2|nr:secreted RxLR effector protein 161-like [Rhagoletis pomonella]
MEDSRDVVTPLDAGLSVHCSSEQCKKVDKVAYQSVVGALMYLAISTRPDILHSVSKLSQRNNNPHSEHEAGVKHVLRYLRKTSNYKLHYTKTGKAIEGFADADWGSDASDRKSYSGCVFVAAGGVFSWESKKQSVVALSSTEAEYIALSSAAKEASYISKLLREMGFGQDGPMILNNDNLSSQCLVKNPTYHARSKHIDIKYHHIRQMYNNNEIDLNYIPTDKMMSDILTKNLQKTKHVKFTNEMGIF